jgi:hypothetical protein
MGGGRGASAWPNFDVKGLLLLSRFAFTVGKFSQNLDLFSSNIFPQNDVIFQIMFIKQKFILHNSFQSQSLRGFFMGCL